MRWQSSNRPPPPWWHPHNENYDLGIRWRAERVGGRGREWTAESEQTDDCRDLLARNYGVCRGTRSRALQMPSLAEWTKLEAQSPGTSPVEGCAPTGWCLCCLFCWDSPDWISAVTPPTRPVQVNPLFFSVPPFYTLAAPSCFREPNHGAVRVIPVQLPANFRPRVRLVWRLPTDSHLVDFPILPYVNFPLALFDISPESASSAASGCHGYRVPVGHHSFGISRSANYLLRRPFSFSSPSAWHSASRPSPVLGFPNGSGVMGNGCCGAWNRRKMAFLQFGVWPE